VLSAACPCKAIGVDRGLQTQVSLLKLRKIKLIRLGQPKELEMTLTAEIHAATFRP
jgi:hypothetical protein